MKNPLNSLPMMNPAVPEGTFRRGFFKGAGSGALMMGIFSSVMAAQFFLLPMIGIPAIAAFSLGSSLGMIGMGTVATGLFSGVTATQRAAESVNSAHNVSHDAQRAPIRGPEHAIAPAMEHASHNSRVWQDKVSADRPRGHDHVSQILADGRLSDRDRAAAILREREQSSTLEAQR